MKIAFVGLPSCGKSTLAKDLHKIVNSAYIPEMARIYIKNIGRPLKSGDQYKIAKMQSDLEKELTITNKLNICDVPVYISSIYDKIYNNGEDVNNILRLSRQHKYDIIFNIVDTPKYKNDGVRYQTSEELIQLKKYIKKYNSNQNVVHITGTNHSKRLDKIIKEIIKK